MGQDHDDYGEPGLPPPRPVPKWVVEVALGAVLFAALLVALAATR